MEKIGLDFLNEFIKSVKPSEPQSYRNMVIFPLYSDMVADNGYVLLDEALKTGKFRIQEVSEGGSVPELSVINELDSDVLILEGEMLIGAKQNRTINSTIIIGKNKKIIIPVSCVEKGRWNYRSRGFQSSDYHVDPDIRRMKAMSVSASLKNAGGYRSDQGRIWNNINHKMRQQEFNSQTDSVSELYESREEYFRNYEKGFSLKDSQIGIAVFTDLMFSGCDIFGVRGIFQKVFHKVLKSYIFEGIEKAYKKGAEEVAIDYMELREQLNLFLRTIVNTQKLVFESFGEGYDIRFDSRNITGFVLAHNEKVVHLAGFRVAERYRRNNY